MRPNPNHELNWSAAEATPCGTNEWMNIGSPHEKDFAALVGTACRAGAASTHGASTDVETLGIAHCSQPWNPTSGHPLLVWKSMTGKKIKGGR